MLGVVVWQTDYKRGVCHNRNRSRNIPIYLQVLEQPLQIIALLIDTSSINSELGKGRFSGQGLALHTIFLPSVNQTQNNQGFSGMITYHVEIYSLLPNKCLVVSLLRYLSTIENENNIRILDR